MSQGSFAEALQLKTRNGDGYLESEDSIVTWCVGHLVTMSYRRSTMKSISGGVFQTLPFYRRIQYEVIPGVAKQFKIVAGLLNREDVTTIYVCTDSGQRRISAAPVEPDIG